MARDSENRLVHEMAGLLLLGMGTLLFLALISYDASDVPSWFPLATHTASHAHVHNFAGKIGAMIACTFYFVFGASAFLIAALMLGLGAVKLMRPHFSIVRRLPWVILFLVSAACLLQLQRFAFLDWVEIRVRPGGELGYWLIGDQEKDHFLKTTFGGFGTFILCSATYATSLVLMIGLHPIFVIRETLVQIPRAFARLREWWATRRADTVEEEEEEVSPRRKTRRTTRNSGPEEEDEEEPSSEPEFDPNRPKPQVIDTTALPATRKPEPLKKPAPDLKDPVLHGGEYVLPSIDLLDEMDPADRASSDPQEMLAIQNTLIDTLQQFGIAVAPGDITRGPTITRYEVYPAKGVRVDKILSLERDLARATRAERINILAPIPGKDTVGIEIANAKKQKVIFRDLLASEEYANTKAKIPLVLGKDVYGKTIIGDLASMPHLLVAGTTGSGKSVCINAIIASILFRFKPDELRFIMIDPKVVEMQVYNSLPHLVVPVVTDPKKVLLALR